MSFMDDPYTVYVMAAYVASVVILGCVIWSTIAANAKAKRALEQLEEMRRK